MNDRLKELIKQHDVDFTIDGTGYGEGNIESLAELIVRECAEACMKEIDIGSMMAPKSPWMAKQILEHFGLK